MTDRQAKERLSSEISREIDLLRQSVYFSEIYKYISLLYPERQTLLDYIPKDTILLMDEPNRLAETARQLERDEVRMDDAPAAARQVATSFVLAVGAEQALYPKGVSRRYFSRCSCGKFRIRSRKILLISSAVPCRTSMDR